MNPHLRMAGVWSAAVFFVCFLIGFVFFAHWIPPLEPSMSATEVGELFRTRTNGILACMVFLGIGSVCYLPFTMVLSELIKEIEGKSYLLSGTQLAAGLVGALTFFLPAFIWAAAAFRPERDPEITQAMVDLGWLIIMTPIGAFILQYVTIATAILIDKRPQPAFPRWVAYLQLWVGISYFPGPVAYFVKTGPFAWSGLFVFWIPLTTFATWFAVMIYYSRRYLLR